MQKDFLQEALIRQERRAAALFVVLFYIIYFVYDLVFYFILPWINQSGEVGYPDPAVTFLSYFCMLILIPITLLLMKRQKPGVVKYLYYGTFLVVTIGSNLIVYSDETSEFRDGNIVELLFVLFSPIFVNKRFFWFVTGGMMVRYAAVGLMLAEWLVVIPMLLVLVLAAIAYIMLNRFLAYLQAIKDTYSFQLEGIVKGIVATLELKDPYTKGHSERVAYYSVLLARRMGIYNENQLKSFYYSCLLHDVGKVHIPDSILLKNGPLTPEEFEVIKTHPVVGAEAMKDIKGLEYTVEVIRHHHERWDGTGYPDRLKGVKIPLLARIVSVADAFDAMTSVRSYRPAMGPEQAYEQIVIGSGTQFDPDIVKLFQSVFPDIREYMRSQPGAGRSGQTVPALKTASGKEVNG